MPRKAGRDGKVWPEPAPEIVQIVRSLAIADARRDHEEAVKKAADQAKARREKRCDADDPKG